MTDYVVISLDKVTPQLRAMQVGDRYSFPREVVSTDGLFSSAVANAGTNAAFNFNTDVAFTGSTLLMQWSNNGTHKASISDLGYLEVGDLAGVSTEYQSNTIEYQFNNAARSRVKLADGTGFDVQLESISATGNVLSTINAVDIFNVNSSGVEVKAGYSQLNEMTAPSGVANKATMYAEDNGAGKTKLMVIFGSGAAQQIAIEP